MSISSCTTTTSTLSKGKDKKKKKSNKTKKATLSDDKEQMNGRHFAPKKFRVRCPFPFFLIECGRLYDHIHAAIGAIYHIIKFVHEKPKLS